ncbi:MFS transporter [Rhodococcus fascians]|nr:MFS transporter [Rhodococcus fascians]MBY4061023.1 MFS transporter [Rhodococcus fascians]MBY4071172.1 MFS transporter [Rhodococcus fascians]
MATHSTDEHIAPPNRKAVVAACFGHAVEWFEFGVYGYLATILGHVFFPSEDPTTSVLSALAVFGVAFFARPVGAVFFGHLGDKLGRRTILAATILLMGGATTCIGLLPSYETIGIFAPILLIALRLLQGLSAGGETSGAAAFLSESAPKGRRALWTSSIQAVGIIAFVCAASLVAVLNAVLGDEAMQSWGWRLPFLLSLPLALVGLYLRFKVEETPAFKAAAKKDASAKERVPIMELFARHKRSLILLIAIVMVEAVASYVAKTYASTYLISTVGLGRTAALLSTSITLLIAAALVPFFAILSDRIGRKPLLLGGTIGLILIAIPAFMLISSGSLLGAIFGQILAIIPGTAISVAVVVAQTELFPTRVRYSGAAFGYNVAYALFGGTAPYVAAALVAASGLKLAPAFYLVGIGLIGLIAMTRLPETFKRDMNDENMADAPARV